MNFKPLSVQPSTERTFYYTRDSEDDQPILVYALNEAPEVMIPIEPSTDCQDVTVRAAAGFLKKDTGDTLLLADLNNRQSLSQAQFSDDPTISQTGYERFSYYEVGDKVTTPSGLGGIFNCTIMDNRDDPDRPYVLRPDHSDGFSKMRIAPPLSDIKPAPINVFGVGSSLLLGRDGYGQPVILDNKEPFHVFHVFIHDPSDIDLQKAAVLIESEKEISDRLYYYSAKRLYSTTPLNADPVSRLIQEFRINHRYPEFDELKEALETAAIRYDLSKLEQAMAAANTNKIKPNPHNKSLSKSLSL